MQLTLRQIMYKTIAVHSVTYFAVGVTAFLLFDYERLYVESEFRFLMRPTDSRWVMAGPLFQPLRGILFGFVFFLLRDVFFTRKDGWLIMWFVLMVVGLLAAFGPTPGSIEGFVFTTLPVSLHLMSVPEILLQTLLLSFVLHYWVNHSDKRLLSWSLGVALFIALALPALGLLVSE